MDVFLIILKIIGIFIVARVLLIFALRAYNQVVGPSIYSEPSNLDLYPRDIDGITIEHIEGDYLNGFHLKPRQKTQKGVVVTFGGSEGSPAYYEAIHFAQGGYEVLSLFSFGMPNQQPTLSKIPLDFFDEVLAYINQHIAEPTPITLYGASKGAELCLNLANYYPEIDHIILVAPSAYNFNGLDFQNLASSWTSKGKELPYISTMQAGALAYLGFLVGSITGVPTSYERLYRTAIENASDAEDKRILQNPVDADLLIFAGGDDRMWPSGPMADVIKEVQGDRAEIHVYEEAGHIFSGNGYIGSESGLIAVGGSKKANQAAAEDYQKVLIERMDQWHQ